MQATDTESNDCVSDQTRPWIDLPPEILFDIAIRLPLIGLLCFRGTCKDFRSASIGATAEIQLSLTPWILMFHENDRSKCLVYNDQELKTYNRTIPDLEGVIFLASYQGWLLLFKDGSIFFFCPFSLAKILLPDFPHRSFHGHVASFSDPPTSPDCVVTVINRITSTLVEINMISKGEKSWSKHVISNYSHPVTVISAATFVGQNRTFYYRISTNSLLKFTVNDKSWKPYQIVKGEAPKDSITIPFYYIENAFKSKMDRLRGPMEIKDDEDIAVCGLTWQIHSKCSLAAVYLNECVVAEPDTNRLRRAVWIQPRFFETDRDHHW